MDPYIIDILRPIDELMESEIISDKQTSTPERFQIRLKDAVKEGWWLAKQKGYNLYLVEHPQVDSSKIGSFERIIWTGMIIDVPLIFWKQIPENLPVVERKEERPSKWLICLVENEYRITMLKRIARNIGIANYNLYTGTDMETLRKVIIERLNE